MSTNNIQFDDKIECTHSNRLDDAIQKSTHNIQFNDKIRKFP